jgi:hypothetical protein
MVPQAVVGIDHAPRVPAAHWHATWNHRLVEIPLAPTVSDLAAGAIMILNHVVDTT